MSPKRVTVRVRIKQFKKYIYFNDWMSQPPTQTVGDEFICHHDSGGDRPCYHKVMGRAFMRGERG